MNIKKKGSGKSQETLVLRLYVAGQTPKSLAAISNLKKICSIIPNGGVKSK